MMVMGMVVVVSRQLIMVVMVFCIMVTSEMVCQIVVEISCGGRFERF